MKRIETCPVQTSLFFLVSQSVVEFMGAEVWLHVIGPFGSFVYSRSALSQNTSAVMKPVRICAAYISHLSPVAIQCFKYG